jgi:hypothetical protein
VTLISATLSGRTYVDEGSDLGFQIAREEEVFQRDAVLEGLVPALDLALGHRMIGRAAQVFDLAIGEPSGEIAGEYSWSRCQTAVSVDPPAWPVAAGWPAAPGQLIHIKE